MQLIKIKTNKATVQGDLLAKLTKEFVPRRINGGGPEGATLEILEYLSKSNESAKCVSPEDRFKFLDHLTVLEIGYLLTIGMTCFNVRGQVPSDILEGNQYIPASNLKSQNYLDEISQ